MPIVRTNVERLSGSFGDRNSTFRTCKTTIQRKPYVVAPFNRLRLYPTSGWVGTSYYTRSDAWGCIQGGFTPELTEREHVLRGQALQKLVKKYLPRAAMAVNLAQTSQTWIMMAGRVRQMLKFFTAITRGQILKAFRALRLDTSKIGTKFRFTKRGMLSDMSGFVLELAYGWIPVVQDIYNGIEVLETDFPVLPVRATSSAVVNNQLDAGVDSEANRIVALTVRLKADLRVTNPNLLLANQLGLLNPAEVFWDLVPFSFVVDQFVGIGKWIRSFNFRAGFDLLNQVTSIKRIARSLLRNKFGTEITVGDAFQRTIGDFVEPSLDLTVRLPGMKTAFGILTDVSLVTQQLLRFSGSR